MCSSRLFKLETEEQPTKTDKLTEKLQNWNYQNSCSPWVRWLCFEQPGPGLKIGSKKSEGHSIYMKITLTLYLYLLFQSKQQTMKNTKKVQRECK